MERRDPTQKALVLAGGGARGSYQVGVWRALMELDWHPQIITGTSVGGLNGAMFVLDLYETARDMWLTIRSRDVMELPEENADLSAHVNVTGYYAVACGEFSKTTNGNLFADFRRYVYSFFFHRFD